MFKTDLEKVSECQIGAIEISDHAMISIKLNLQTEKRSTVLGLNNSLLKDADFKNTIKKNNKTILRKK